MPWICLRCHREENASYFTVSSTSCLHITNLQSLIDSLPPTPVWMLVSYRWKMKVVSAFCMLLLSFKPSFVSSKTFLPEYSVSQLSSSGVVQVLIPGEPQGKREKHYFSVWHVLFKNTVKLLNGTVWSLTDGKCYALHNFKNSWYLCIQLVYNCTSLGSFHSRTHACSLPLYIGWMFSIFY